MKFAAILGFLTGTAITLWAFLRSWSHGESDFGYMDTVQTNDPRVEEMVSTITRSWSFSVGVDCE